MNSSLPQEHLVGLKYGLLIKTILQLALSFQTQVTQSKTNLSDNQTTGRLRLLEPGDQL